MEKNNNTKILGGILAGLLVCCLVVNIQNQAIWKSISDMSVSMAESLSNKKIYHLSNICYEISKSAYKPNHYADYNIAKNIINEQWDNPLNDYKKQELKKALELLNEEAKVHPNNIYINEYKAHSYYLLEEYDKAITLYKEILKVDPNWAYGIRKLSYCYSKKRDYKTSITYLEEYMKLSKDDLDDSYYGLGCLYSALGEYEKAVEYYEKATVINPNRVDAWINLSYVSELYLKNYDKAVKYAKKALELNKYSQYANSNMAYALIMQKKYDEALPYTNYNLSNSGSARSYFQMGLIMYGKGKNAEAKQYLEKAIDLEKIENEDDSKEIIKQARDVLNKIK